MPTTMFMGFDSVAVHGLKTYAEALELAGLVGKNAPTVKAIIVDTLDEDMDLTVAVIASMPETDYEEEIVKCFINTYEDEAGEIKEKAPSSTLKARIRNARLLCVESTWPTISPTQSATTTTAPADMPSTVTARKLKLKDLVDQISEEECEILSEAAIATCYARYEAIMGFDERPAKSEDPTQEQLSAVAYLLRTGINPYVDFGIFGPYGQRILKKVRLTGAHFNNENELVRIEINGPANYGMWTACWNIFQNCLVMLDAVDLGKLIAYKKKQDHYYETHGEKIWALQYQTDVRTRAEHFVRIKRDGLADYNRAWSECLHLHGNIETAKDHFKNAYDPARPWDFVFHKALKDTEWWFEEIGLKALKAQNPAAHIEHDAPVSHTGHKRTLPPGDPSGNTSGLVQQPKKPRAARVHNVKDGHYQTSRHNIELCPQFNWGRCPHTLPNNKCPNNSSQLHLCSKCLQPRHNATTCHAVVTTPAWAEKGGKLGKGAGRGGKNGKGGKAGKAGQWWS